MKLRPRYSLLTLLVLTALIAGGVKLWRGPYHVVERVSPAQEDEYSYTRDWHGDKIILGHLISRRYYSGQLGLVEVKFFRQGELLNWHYYSLSHLDAEFIEPFPSTAGGAPLTSKEQDEFKATVERVKLKKEPGQRVFVEEIYYPQLP